jgi:hypothetical protein
VTRNASISNFQGACKKAKINVSLAQRISNFSMEPVFQELMDVVTISRTDSNICVENARTDLNSTRANAPQRHGKIISKKNASSHSD